MPQSLHSAEAQTDFYTLLGLPFPRDKDDAIPVRDIKAAYRQALLLYHPDKVQQNRQHESSDPSITIDRVHQAYQTLLSPVTQGAYRLKVLDRAHQLRRKESADIALTAETVDLEDLDWDFTSATWKKSCRCGGGYSIAEDQLEHASSVGELVVGCYSCSLHIRVMFGVVVDDDQSAMKS